MERIATFNMPADLATLQSALGTGEVTGQLQEPIQALVQKITAAAAEHPVSIYLCSPDEHARSRDHFAYLLARSLTRHIPSTLLIDCDFIEVGLHGLVPESDALGFLDLLLYGSSIGVITQQAAGGVKTVGAGSFPVTKRMPFVMSAFEDANRRLVSHARCAVFVGPLFGDEGDLHPLLGAVDTPLLVRELTHSAADAIDPVEERIANAWESELTSVRLVSPRSGAPRDETFSRVLGDDVDAEAEPPLPASPEPPAPPRGAEPTFAELADSGSEDDDLNAPPPAPPPPPVVDTPPAPDPQPGPVPAPPSVPPFGPAAETPRGSRRAVLTAIVIAVVASAAAVWWIGRDRAEQMASSATQSTPSQPAATTEGGGEDGSGPATVADTSRAVATRDTVAGRPEPVQTPPERTGVVETVVEEPEYVDPADTGGRSGGTVHLSSHDIHVMEDLQRNWPDSYFIHISSFRRSVEAREEVAFLESREFPVFIVFLDLDAKGKWYRVYAGPFATRDEAREVKKSLDDIPRVRFTRITKISG